MSEHVLPRPQGLGLLACRGDDDLANTDVLWLVVCKLDATRHVLGPDDASHRVLPIFVAADELGASRMAEQLRLDGARRDGNDTHVVVRHFFTNAFAQGVHGKLRAAVPGVAWEGLAPRDRADVDDRPTPAGNV